MDARAHRWALVLGVCQWMHLLFPGRAWADSLSISPGPFATHIAMMVPLVAIAAWPKPNGLGWRLSAAIVACVALLFLGLAGESRILWVALIAAALVAFALFAAGLPRGGRARTLATRAFLAGLVLLIALMALSTESKFSVYPGARSTYEMLTLDERPVIWRIAAEKVADAPLLGHGYGRDIVGEDMRRGLQRASVLPYNHAHSVFLDVALQLGGVGSAIFVAMMAALAVALFAGRRTAAGLPIAIAGLALMTAYALKNVTDDFYFRTNSLLFWAVMGMMLGRAARARREP